jgi:hypothetical protein
MHVLPLPLHLSHSFTAVFLVQPTLFVLLMCRDGRVANTWLMVTSTVKELLFRQTDHHDPRRAGVIFLGKQSVALAGPASAFGAVSIDDAR